MSSYPFRYVPDNWNRHAIFRMWRNDKDNPSAIALETLLRNWVRVLFLTSPWCSVVEIR